MSKFVKLSFAVFLVLTLSALAMAQSQSTSGQIVGTVTDQQGAAVANATAVRKRAHRPPHRHRVSLRLVR